MENFPSMEKSFVENPWKIFRGILHGKNMKTPCDFMEFDVEYFMFCEFTVEDNGSP